MRVFRVVKIYPLTQDSVLKVGSLIFQPIHGATIAETHDLKRIVLNSATVDYMRIHGYVEGV
jgi:hypothetical protein